MKYDFIPKKDIPTQDLSFWQSPYWHDILEASSHVREVFYFGNVTSTFFLIEIRSIGLGQFGAFSIGTLPTQIGDDAVEFFRVLREELRKKKVIFFQIEPLDGEIPIVPKLRKQVYREFLYPYTRIIDLTVSMDDIQAQMHEKGRYHVRLAEKRNVSVQEVPHTQENIDIWMQLLAETVDRDGFSANNRAYYESFLRILGDQAKLYFAYWNDRVIAAGIWVFYPHRAIYYYGASSGDREDRKQMAPYLLQWHAIMEAKKANIDVYDMLGVADPDNPHDSLVGVTQFKARFGGEVVRLPQKYIVSFSKKTRWFFVFRRLKKWWKKIKKSLK